MLAAQKIHIASWYVRAVGQVIRLKFTPQMRDPSAFEMMEFLDHRLCDFLKNLSPLNASVTSDTQEFLAAFGLRLSP